MLPRTREWLKVRCHTNRTSDLVRWKPFHDEYVMGDLEPFCRARYCAEGED